MSKYTRLLAENERLKAENEKMSVKIDAYELYGDQHEEEYNQAFNQGTEAAWELVRKIGNMPHYEAEETFDIDSISDIVKCYTYHEAAAKVSEREKAKEEIKVGDIIRSDKDSGFYALIVNIDKETQTAFLITENRSLTFLRLDQCFKTGRHIDIDSFLKQIRGEE